MEYVLNSNVSVQNVCRISPIYH